MKSIKSILKKGLQKIDRNIKLSDENLRERIYIKFKNYTMNPKKFYLYNLELVNQFKNIEGDIVECGVWRGGMIAGIATLLGKSRNYFLYDSFEGLPPAKEIDGKAAIDWQKDKASPAYFDNCKAEISFAQEAMNMTHVQYQCVKGWFDETLPNNSHEKIAILRLDGDWYDSTMTCLKYLFPKVVKGGLII